MAGSSAFPLSLEVRELIMWSYHSQTDGQLDRGTVVQLLVVSDPVIVSNNARKGKEEWPAKGSQQLIVVVRLKNLNGEKSQERSANRIRDEFVRVPTHFRKPVDIQWSVKQQSEVRESMWAVN